MKKLNFTIAATLLLSASAAFGQAVPVPLEPSVGATADAAWERNGGTGTRPSEAMQANAANNCHSGNGPFTVVTGSGWKCYAKAALNSLDLIGWFEKSLKNATNGGDFGGAGTSGSGWELSTDAGTFCDNFKVNFLDNNWMRVPSIPLPGGPPHQASTSSPSAITFYNNSTSNGTNMGGSTATNFWTGLPQSVVLYSLHGRNKKLLDYPGGDEKHPMHPSRWGGVYAFTTSGANGYGSYQWATKRWFRPADGQYGQDVGGISPYGFTTFHRQNNYKSCPAETAAGTDFDFYTDEGSKTCTWFHGEYAYPQAIDLQQGQWNAYFSQQNADWMGCDLSETGIERITEEVWEECAATGTCPPPEDVQPEDIRDCFNRPANMGGLNTSGSYTDCGQPTPPTDRPDTGTDPPDEGGGGGDGAPDGWYDQPAGGDVNIPDFGLEMPDWWPNLPNLDFGSATCPTYQLDLQGFFGQTFVVDSHCPIIADFRSTIAAIMLVCWTMAAAVIVMRA